jgi:prepilin-type N-terminal cleavage/methylation domain-containing protein
MTQTSHSTHRGAPRHTASSGFSLIEVLIAMVVFAIGVLSLAICIPLGTHKIDTAGNQTHASELAAQRAEALLITPYGDNDLTAGVHTDANNPVDGQYYIDWTVTDDAPVKACKRVVVQVSRGSASHTPDAQVTIVTPESGG